MKGKCGMSGCWMGKLACLLLIIGSLNWGILGIGMWSGNADLNVLHMILGSWGWLEALVYVLVGLSALMKLFGGCRCGLCKGGSCEAK